MKLDAHAGIESLRHSFEAAGEALARAEAILRLQHRSLADDPPPALPEQARLAAVSRLRGSEPLVPRVRFPVDELRLARLFDSLSEIMTPSVVLPAPRLISEAIGEAAQAAALEDATALDEALGGLGLEAQAARALLRESLKPELLQTTLALAEIVRANAPDEPRCPTCHSRPAVGTRGGTLCCSWCGSCWDWSLAGCWACGSDEVKTTDVRGLEGAVLRQCQECGVVLLLVDAPAEPLSLSMHGILASPFQLAAMVAGGAEPRVEFAVF